MRTVHRTLGMAPDMYLYGRMRTPSLRAEHERTTATLSHLLTGPTALVSGLQSSSDPLARPTMAQQTRVTEFTAACVALHLETLDILHSQAHSATAKTQTLNRLKMSGNKLSSSILHPRSGSVLQATGVQAQQFQRPQSGRTSQRTRSYLCTEHRWLVVLRAVERRRREGTRNLAVAI